VSNLNILDQTTALFIRDVQTRHFERLSTEGQRLTELVRQLVSVLYAEVKHLHDISTIKEQSLSWYFFHLHAGHSRGKVEHIISIQSDLLEHLSSRLEL
jgi:hypothetical protein